MSLGGFLFKHRCIHQREHSITTLLTRLSCSNIGVFTKEDITLSGHPAYRSVASPSGNPDWPTELLTVISELVKVKTLDCHVRARLTNSEDELRLLSRLHWNWVKPACLLDATPTSCTLDKSYLNLSRFKHWLGHVRAGLQKASILQWLSC